MPTPFDFSQPLEAASNLIEQVRIELEAAARRASIDTPRRSEAQSVGDGLYIFREIFDRCGNAERAKAEALDWPGLPPEIYRKGPESYVEDWLFYNRPADWKPNGCR